VCGIEGADDAEAEGNALDEFLPRFQIRAGRKDDNLAEIFGNDRFTFCATRDCDESYGLDVHVVRSRRTC
jgi:hypothetical protein